MSSTVGYKKNTKQVPPIRENKTQPKAVTKTTANTKIETTTKAVADQALHLARQIINTNTHMEKKKNFVLFPDHKPVSEEMREDTMSMNDSELRTVSDQENSQDSVKPSEIIQKEVLLQTKVDENIGKAQPFKDGIIAHTKPKYLKNPPPEYPRLARKLSYTGKVTLKVEVKTDGSCGHVEIIKTSGYSMLDKAAVKAVKEWQFLPAKKWGQPVSSFTEIVINFQLK